MRSFFTLALLPGFNEQPKPFLRASMSRSGNCWDNAVAESFFSTLETELLSRNRFATHTRARRAISEYIDQFLTPLKRHSTNGYISSIVFELCWQAR